MTVIYTEIYLKNPLLLWPELRYMIHNLCASLWSGTQASRYPLTGLVISDSVWLKDDVWTHPSVIVQCSNDWMILHLLLRSFLSKDVGRGRTFGQHSLNVKNLLNKSTNGILHWLSSIYNNWLSFSSSCWTTEVYNSRLCFSKPYWLNYKFTMADSVLATNVDTLIDYLAEL